MHGEPQIAPPSFCQIHIPKAPVTLTVPPSSQMPTRADAFSPLTTAPSSTNAPAHFGKVAVHPRAAGHEVVAYRPVDEALDRYDQHKPIFGPRDPRDL